MANTSFDPKTDFEEESNSSGFNPSTDFQEEQSLPQELWQGAKDVVGGLGTGVLDQIKGIASQGGSFNRAMGIPSIGGLVSQGADAIAGQLPGNPNDLMYDVGQYGPAVLGGAKAAYDLAPLAYQAGKAGVNALGDMPGISQLIGRNVTKATEDLADKTKNVLADLYNNPDFAAKEVNNSDKVFGNENYLSSDIINKNYEKQSDLATTKYTNALKNVGDNPAPYTPIENYLDEIMNAGKGGLQNNVNKLLETYIDNPTVENGHWLQSGIGASIRDLYKKPYDSRDDDLINSLTEARNGIRDYISEAAGPQYQAASDFYKNNVIPYTENRLIANMAQQGKVGSANALTKLLSNGELEDADRQSLNAIAGHMTDDQKDQMLLPFLKGTKNNPLVTTGGDVNPDVLLNSINGLKFQGLDQFVTPKMQNYFNVLNDAKNNIASQQKIRNAARWAGTFGAGSVTLPAGFEFLRHVL